MRTAAQAAVTRVVSSHGAPFAPGSNVACRALVVAGTEAGPRDEVRCSGEARHVDADLDHDDVAAMSLMPGVGFSSRALSWIDAEAFPTVVDLLQRTLQGIDEAEVQLDHRAMMGCHSPMERSR